MDHHTGTCLLAGQPSAKADVETAWHCLWLPSALTVAEKAGDVVCAAVSSPVTSLWFLSLTHWSAVHVPVSGGAVFLVCPETSAVQNCITRRCCLLPLHLSNRTLYLTFACAFSVQRTTTCIFQHV